MSLFSDHLAKTIEECGETIRHLSLVSGVERTTLVRATKGTRPIRREQLDVLCDAMLLPPHDRRALKRAYDMTMYGEGKFLIREKVQAIIEDIARFSLVQASEAPTSNSSKSDFFGCREGDIQNIYGEFAIKKALSELITAENQQLYFSMPHDFQYFYDQLFLKSTSSKAPAINCFISFVKATDENGSLNNLDVLSSVVPFLISPNENFTVNYVYSPVVKKDLFAIPAPYFIYGSEHLMLFHDGMNRAILTKNESMREYYQETCHEFVAESKPLLDRVDSLMGALELLNYEGFADTGDTTKGLISFEHQPCLLIYFDIEMVRKYTTSAVQNDDVLMSTFASHRDTARQHMKGRYSYFTAEGLDLLVDTGALFTLPSAYASPFDVADRIKLLQIMLADLIDDRINFRMVDSTKFLVPTDISFSGFADRHTLIAKFDGAAGVIRSISIQEPSIKNAFFDFFDNLADSGLICTKEETVRAVQAALKVLEGRC